VAGRQQYTEQAKAAAFAQLEMNDGNIKRTARDLGLPPSTLRAWRDEWEQNKNLPAAEDLIQATGDFVEDAERVRNLALQKMEAKLLNNEGTVAQIATVMGILDDKIARAKGLADRVTEHKITLPSREEIVSALQGLQQGAIEAAAARDEVIVEAELVEAKALPPAKQ
jgi:transposase-like protein